MRIGISLTTSIPSAVGDVRGAAARIVERAQAASDAGLDSLFVGDHHVTGPTPYYQNVPLMGRLLATWDDRTSGALFLLPVWNPVLLAEQVGTLAALAGGRFVMQCGIGDAHQSRGHGADPHLRGKRFEESLAICRALWAGETVEGTGHYRFGGATIAPLPPEPVEVWLAAGADVGLDRAARLADAWIAHPGVSREQGVERLDYFFRRCEFHGRPLPTVRPIRREVHVADSPAAAQAFRDRLAAKGGHRGIADDCLVIGDIDSVTRHFAALADDGWTDIIVRNISSDQAEMLGTITRLAEVRQALAHL